MEITVTEQFAQQLEILNQQLTELNQSDLIIRLKRLEDDTEYLKSVPHLIAIIEDIESYYSGAKQILTASEACKYMGLSNSQLYKLTSASKIPHFKPNGKLMYFFRADLDAWMSSSATNP